MSKPKSNLICSEMQVMASSKALVSNEILSRAYLLIGNIDVVPVAQSMNWRIVELCIQGCSSPIFYSVLESGDSENHYQRYSIERWVGDSEYAEDLYATVSDRSLTYTHSVSTAWSLHDPTDYPVALQPAQLI
jgi:hypothetical protein